jgi:hypothetical protein
MSVTNTGTPGPWTIVAVATGVAVTAGVLAYYLTLAEPYRHGARSIAEVLSYCRAHMDEGCGNTRDLIYYGPISKHVAEAIVGSIVVSALVGVWVLKRRRSA